MTASPGGFKPHVPNITGDEPADGETVQWDATAKAWKAVTPSAGGTASSTPGQAAHYIGTWDIAVAYAAGECVRQWDGAAFKLYQAKKATTGEDPTSVVAAWAEVTTPIVMWGSDDPITADPTNAHGFGIPGSNGMVYLWKGSMFGGSYGSAILVYDDDDGTWLTASEQTVSVPAGGFVSMGVPINLDMIGEGGGYIDVSTAVIHSSDDTGWIQGNRDLIRQGTGNGDSDGHLNVERKGTGNGNAIATAVAARRDAGTGGADAHTVAVVGGTVAIFGPPTPGVAVAGDKAIHDTGGEAYVLPKANATEAFIDVKGPIDAVKQTDAAAPAANHGRLYLRDDGSGKMQFVARFPSGAVQIIATEP